MDSSGRPISRTSRVRSPRTAVPLGIRVEHYKNVSKLIDNRTVDTHTHSSNCGDPSPATQPQPARSTRLPLPAPPYTPEVERLVGNGPFTALAPRNLRLALAHQPGLAAAFQSMAQQILFKCSLPEREREIAIIRTGALTRSEYEWGMHVSHFAERCQINAEQLAELTLGQPGQALWTERERLIVAMVDELHHHSTVSDATWAQLSMHWPPDQIVELILASSFYHMAAFFLNSMAVPLEVGAARFPAGIESARVAAATRR